MQLPRGKHLFFKFLGRSRTGISYTVSVLVKDPQAQGLHLANVSRDIASAVFRTGFNPRKNAAILKPRQVMEPNVLGLWIAGELGKTLHQDAEAFTWEWI